MIRKFKTLGIAMVAVLAISAVVATAAQTQFTASSYPKSATAESLLGDDTFETEAGTVQCEAHFAVGPLNAASSTVNVAPTYTNCSAFGFTATVNMNGCAYVLHDSAVNLENKATINCPAGKSIQIIAGPCEATIPAQSPLGNVITLSSGSHIDLQFWLKGITYNVTKDGFLCPYKGVGHKAGGTYVHDNPVTVIPIGGGSVSVH